MRVSRIQAEENRQSVINAAGRLFREHGFNGIGLTDLMKAAGLTHGGFYKQFRSKEDLMMQACGRALDESKGKWMSIVARATKNPLADLIRFYLSARHRDHSGNGCVFAALGTDTARGTPAMQETFEEGIKTHLKILDGLAPAGREASDESMVTLSTMVGALILSRAVKDAALSQRFLDSAANAITGENPEDTARQQRTR